ncbi:MAG: pyridoxal phosphate-dependent aminotransferase [Candidatus Desulfofervidaceae bacterium]|nr:pyridoxal phosphate-dependent aminotransferase [Candidatus Desulfofervidaceae bacterium]
MIAKRAQEIPPFIVMDVLERAQALERQGESIIHLEVGEPDFDTPACVKRAAEEALVTGKTHYTHSLGIPELRETIATHYQQRYGVEVSPENVVVTAGTSPAMLLIFASLLEPGDEIILPDPHYACYPNFIRFLGGQPIFVPVREENNFVYDVDEVKKAISPRTKGILINSPSNPTGMLTLPEVMKDLTEFGLPIISDEIYHHLVYEGKERSILEFTNNAFVLNGFSKAYAMTGWRLGYLIAPPTFIRPIQKMQQNFFICAPSLAQYAGVTALKEAEPDVVKMRLIYNERRLYLYSALKEMGFSLKRPPEGAFYFFINVKHISQDSYSLAFDILEKAKVAVTPGIDFGKGGEGYLRLSYANSLENIKEGLRRLKEYLERDAD